MNEQVDLGARLLTTEDVAARVHVDAQTVRRWVRDGELPMFLVGKQYLIGAAQFDAWIAAKAEANGKGA